MNPLHTLPARWDWPSAIGNFILAFGHLDYLVFAFLKNRLSREEFASVRERPFKERLRKIAQVLERDSGSEDLRSEFQALGERLEAMRNFRNSIAHGHLLCDAGSEEAARMVMLTLPKEIDLPISLLSTAVRLEEIVAECGVLDGLILDFQRLVGFESKVTLEASSETAMATVSWYSQKRPE